MEQETPAEVVTPKPRKARKYAKKPDLNTKVGKYYAARMSGKTKKDAQIAAGYKGVNNSTQIERTKTFQALAYKDELLNKISLSEIADAHADNIRQEGDRGARNTAIKMAYEKIEGQETPEREEKVVFIMATPDKVIGIEQTKKIG